MSKQGRSGNLHAVARLIPRKPDVSRLAEGFRSSDAVLQARVKTLEHYRADTWTRRKTKGLLLRGHGFLNRADGPTFLHQTLMNILF